MSTTTRRQDTDAGLREPLGELRLTATGLAKEAAADEDVREGRVLRFDSVEALLDDFENGQA